MTVMKSQIGYRLLAIVIALGAGAAPAASHPGVSLVMDSRGNVYYTDLRQVWKLAPDGKKTIAVRNVHTHELYIDRNDNLYGEHLWYEGEATDRWGHRVWRLAPDGTLTDIIGPRQGFREDYDDFYFVRDGTGNMYWAERGDTTLVRMRTPAGVSSTLARAKFTDVRWMTVTPGGTIYLTDLYDLVRVTPEGSVGTVARDLAAWNASRLAGPDRHAVMGLWTDTPGHVYAAVFADREVRKITPDGKVEVVARSSAPWAPTGGMVGPNGDLWLLEYSATNEARVRRIGADGKITIFD